MSPPPKRKPAPAAVVKKTDAGGEPGRSMAPTRIVIFAKAPIPGAAKTRLIPALQKAGVRALKIEGRQRSRAYVGQVVRAFRAAVEAADAGAPMPEGLLAKLTEGQAATTGAYAKTWR